MKQLLTTLASFLIFTSLFAQQKPYPEVSQHEMSVNGQVQNVYQITVPVVDGMEHAWLKVVKDRFGVKLKSSDLGQYQSKEFKLPYSQEKGAIQSWITLEGDSAVLNASVALASGGYANELETPVVDSLLSTAMDAYNFDQRMRYYEDRIANIRNKRKSMEQYVDRINKQMEDSRAQQSGSTGRGADNS